jgi:hypothetical protein
MTNDMYSIIERLAILEGRIAPTDSKPITETKQKKPALFNNLKKTDEMFMPSVGGVEMAEDNMEEDVLSKVKASLADYLHSAEADINQDRDLLAKKKQDLDLKKRELRDLALQTKPDHVQHTEEYEIEEDPNQTPAGGEAPAGLTDPTYAESVGSAPVKTIHVPVEEEVGLSGGGGAVLVEIHGDEREGFRICRAGKELPTRFRTLEECEMALEMYMARRKAQHVADESADYIEEA